MQKAQATNEALEVEQEYAAAQSSLTFAVEGVEIEVDTQTGRITVLRCAQVVDIGKAINPRICYGQVHGAMVMGLGYALSEELRFKEPRADSQPHTTHLSATSCQRCAANGCDFRGATRSSWSVWCQGDQISGS